MPEKASPARSGKTAVQGTSADTTHATSDMETLRAMGFGTITQLGAAWAETMGELGTEVASFVAERIKEDVKTQHEILHCKDPAELQEIQARFLKTAFDQYTAETGKLVEMSQEFFRTTGEKGN